MTSDLAKTEQKMKEIAKANAETAVDQAQEYPSDDHAYASYLINALDTMAEEGIKAPRAMMVVFYMAAYEKAKDDAGLGDFNYI